MAMQMLMGTMREKDTSCGGTLPSRAMPSEPARGLALSALVNGASAAGVDLPDTLVHPPCDLDTPLPSIQTKSGREALCETPSYIIAAHLMHTASVDPQSACRRAEGLEKKLKETAKFQKAIVSEKITVEEKLRRTDAALRDAIEDNHVLRSRCSKLTEVVASLRLQVEDQQAALMAQTELRTLRSPQKTDGLIKELNAKKEEIASLKKQLRNANLNNA